MPEIGEIGRAREIGVIGTSRYIWQACPNCGKERWVHTNKGIYLCRRCVRVGQENANWKGGRRKDVRGYILVWISQDDFFYPMASEDGYVLEHRLVMAKKLGRCLLRSEVVHHRPDVAKDDNREEVLCLMPNSSDHSRLIPCSHCELKKEIRLLQWQIKEQSEQIKLLTSRGQVLQ